MFIVHGPVSLLTLMCWCKAVLIQFNLDVMSCESMWVACFIEF